jgi:hypothetical protein
VDLQNLTPRESLIDISVKFSDKSVLILRKTRIAGKDYVRVDMVNVDDGKIIQSYIVNVEDTKYYENIHGKAFKQGVIVHPSDEGIVREKISDRTAAIIADSDKFISGNEYLYPYGDDVLAVTNNRVILIKPRKGR